MKKYYVDSNTCKGIKSLQESIIYNGVRVIFRDMKYLYKYATKCPICSEHIYKDDAIYSIMNNYALFPSVAVHKGCVGSKEECIKQLISSYTKFKEFLIENKFWYNKQYF